MRSASHLGGLKYYVKPERESKLESSGSGDIAEQLSMALAAAAIQRLIFSTMNPCEARSRRILIDRRSQANRENDLPQLERDSRSTADSYNSFSTVEAIGDQSLRGQARLNNGNTYRTAYTSRRRCGAERLDSRSRSHFDQTTNSLSHFEPLPLISDDLVEKSTH